MRVGRDEAFDLFRKWFTDRTLLRCEGRFAIHSFSMRLRILGVNPPEIRFMADDTASELVFRVTDDVRLGYLDSRQVEGREAADYQCAIVGLMGSDEDPDSIVFAEIKNKESI